MCSRIPESTVEQSDSYGQHFRRNTADTDLVFSIMRGFTLTVNELNSRIPSAEASEEHIV